MTRRFSIRTVAALSLLGAVALPLASEATGATPGPNTMVAVPGDVNVATMAGVTPAGTTAPTDAETVSFILQEQNQYQLRSSVSQGLKSFLSVNQFAAQYGQSADNIAQLQTYLSGFGITTTVYPGNVDVVASGNIGEFNRALGVSQQLFHVPARPGSAGILATPAQTVRSATSGVRLPYRIAKYVTAVLGLSTYAPFVDHVRHAPRSATATSAATVTSAATPQHSNSIDCVALTDFPQDCNTPANFAQHYSMNALYQQNKVGQGRTIGIVTLAALDPGAPEYFWQHYLHLYSNHDRVTVKNIDGGPGAPDDASGTGETDLDVEQSGGVAPGANVVVYQAPNTDNGFVDAFFAAASENVADSVSASWGSSETILQASINAGYESPGYAAAFDEVFLELAAQGQSTFVASGDAGAYDASADLGSTNLSIDNPSDSPYVTAAGGTTLPWSSTVAIPGLLDNSANINVTSERAWGWDYLSSALSSANPLSPVDPATLFELFLAGGGGGYSAFEPQPSYQSGVSGISTYTSVQYLTPKTFVSAYGLYFPTDWNFNPAPTPSSHRAPSTRATPDLSANADPLTGYLVYEPSALTAAVPLPALQGGYGGTSFVAPQFAGATAVLASAVGHRVGLWNPALYSLARGPHSPLTPLSSASTSNDNDFYTGTAGTLFNPATGLGILNFSQLATDYTRYWFTN